MTEYLLMNTCQKEKEQFRVVTNGYRYRVQTSKEFGYTGGGTSEDSRGYWTPVIDFRYLGVRLFSIFETRWLWRARLRLERERTKAARKLEKDRRAKLSWFEVE